MSDELKLEKLSDLFDINHEKLRVNEAKAVITRVKQLLKLETKTEEIAEEKAQDYPYEAVSIVGNKYVNLTFDIDKKVARVVDVEVDPRDIRGRNTMAAAKAINKIKQLYKTQKES